MDRKVNVAWPLLVLAGVLAAVTLASCGGYRHQQFRAGDKSRVTDKQFDLYFVEADDEGWFWEPEQATKALEAVRRAADDQNTFVLLFVHGWHHSARCCDSNVLSLRKTLRQLHTELSKQLYTEARSQHYIEQKTQDDFKVIGIYIGWRGRSLPGVFDFFTFWGRKSAAERVGEADVREFIARLNQLYLEKRSVKGSQRFLGLISIGHSFGAQVLLRATAATLEDQLISLRAPPGYLGQDKAGVPEADKVALQGIGDLVILLNPATEAAAYQRLHLLSMGLRYEQTQTPVMLTLSADNDHARHKLFSAGRRLGEFFTGKPRKDNELEREAERVALGIDGSYVRHVTHRVEPVDMRERLIVERSEPEVEPDCDSEGECAADWRVWEELPDRRLRPDVPSRNGDLDELRNFDFAGAVRLGNVDLKPGEGAIPLQPLIVATSSPAVIDDHSGVFTEPFLQFLIPYIALIESKIALNRDADVEQKQRALRQ